MAKEVPALETKQIEDKHEITSRKLLRIKVTPDLHLIYSKNGGNLGLVLKMKNVACL